MNEETIQQIEVNIEKLPDEVRDFIFSDEMTAIKKELAAQLENESEKKEMINGLMLFLFGVTSIEDLNTYINSLTISPEKKAAIKTLIRDRVIEEMILLVEVYKELDGEKSNEAATVIAPNPSQVLATIAERMTEAKAVAPTRRDYSIARSMSTPNSITMKSSGTQTPDPYRETPK